MKQEASWQAEQHVINSFKIYGYTSRTAWEGPNLEVNWEKSVSRICSCMHSALEWIMLQLQAATHGADFSNTAALGLISPGRLQL